MGKSKKILGKHSKKMQYTFTNSLVASKDLIKGTKIKKIHLKAMKPGNGIPIKNAFKVIGKRLSKNYKLNEPFRFKDLQK